MPLQRSKNWGKNLKITFEFVPIFQKIYDASKAPDHVPLNKVSRIFWYRSQAIPQKAIPGSLLVHWRITTGFEGLPLQNLDLISSTFSTSKSFVAGGAVANTCCWNSTEPTLTPIGGKRTEVCCVRSDALHGSLQLFLDRDFGCPRMCFFWIFSSLLNVNRFSSTRKNFFGWDFTFLSKRSKGFQFKLKRLVTWERRALIRERSSFWGLWNKRFQNCALVDKICTFLNCTRGCSGL